MAWDFLTADTMPRLLSRTRVVPAMAAVGAFAGLFSSLPSPLPEIRLDSEGVILNAHGIPLHAGLVFAAGIAWCIWHWVMRDIGKCLLCMMVIFVGWLVAVNTANDAYQALIGSAVFGTEEGAKASREVLGLLAGGVIGGAVGAGLTAFGAGIPAEAIRRTENWTTIVIAGAATGTFLYPAAALSLPPIIFVPWQALVAGAIGLGLTRKA